ncbi:MAG: fasciclin domain-containing protein [Gemmatimonadaceae bacterium]
MVAAGRSRAHSLNGQELDIEARHGRVVYANGARVVRADVPASNGVIHVIDAVVMPTPWLAVRGVGPPPLFL